MKSTILRKVTIVCVLIATVLVVCTGCGSKKTTGEKDSNNTDKYDENATYYAVIDIIDYGAITVKLDQKNAPITVENFVSLAREGFYEGLTFHRIMEGFMMQGGAPKGDKVADTIVGEFTANGHNNTLSHTRGAISMARTNVFDSASSQFFIVHQDSTFLDGQYAAFGYVTEGIEVVDKVCQESAPTDSNGSIAEDKQPVIKSVTIKTE